MGTLPGMAPSPLAHAIATLRALHPPAAVAWIFVKRTTALPLGSKTAPCAKRPTPGSSLFGRRTVVGVLGTLLASSLARLAHATTLPLLPRVLARASPPIPPPVMQFMNATGKIQTLAEYRGKGVVLNVWATWCLPCRAEMPALDRLAVLAAPDGIVVLPISIDTGGLKAVRKFDADNHIAHLPILLDPEGHLAAALQAPGVPTTVIVNRTGLIAGRVEGPVNWDAPASIALLRDLVGQAK